MRVRLGLLREFLLEAMLNNRTTSVSAPTDSDATVPGHLPNELPKSASLEDDGIDEEAIVPGRWAPNGLEFEPYDHERLGDPIGQPSGAEGDLDETDDRMIGDGKGNGIPDPSGEDDDIKISPHLKGDEEKLSLGSPPEEKPEKGNFGESVRWSLNEEIKRYMQQRTLLVEYPAGAGMVDPTTDPKGFYTDYDAPKDHGDGEYIQSPWYQSPGREPGADGDPFRSEDPQARLQMHPSENDPTTVHPAVSGLEGVAARRAPPIPELEGGSDTSTTLGPGAKPGGGSVESDDESEEDEEGEGAEGEGADGDQAQDEEQG